MSPDHHEPGRRSDDPNRIPALPLPRDGLPTGDPPAGCREHITRPVLQYVNIPVLIDTSSGVVMRRTEVRRRLRHMRFVEAHGGWTERRLKPGKGVPDPGREQSHLLPLWRTVRRRGMEDTVYFLGNMNVHVNCSVQSDALSGSSTL